MEAKKLQSIVEFVDQSYPPLTLSKGNASTPEIQNIEGSPAWKYDYNSKLWILSCLVVQDLDFKKIYFPQGKVKKIGKEAQTLMHLRKTDQNENSEESISETIVIHNPPYLEKIFQELEPYWFERGLNLIYQSKDCKTLYWIDEGVEVYFNGLDSLTITRVFKNFPNDKGDFWDEQEKITLTPDEAKKVFIGTGNVQQCIAIYAQDRESGQRGILHKNSRTDLQKVEEFISKFSKETNFIILASVLTLPLKEVINLFKEKNLLFKILTGLLPREYTVNRSNGLETYVLDINNENLTSIEALVNVYASNIALQIDHDSSTLFPARQAVIPLIGLTSEDAIWVDSDFKEPKVRSLSYYLFEKHSM